MCSRRSRTAITALAFAFVNVAPAFAQPQQTDKPLAAGRVVVTVTTLDGAVHLPGVQVELRPPDDQVVIAKSVTDGSGQVVFPDIPPGAYVVNVSRPGFDDLDSTPFVVRANETAQVLLDTELVFVLPEVQVRGELPSPTDSVQPVSMSDMLAGSVFEMAPLQGDDFQSLLPLLPGVVRDADGRLRIRGGRPSQGALQVSSASLNDPSTGDFDLDLPAQSVQSVEVLPNPFAAEYGRFSSSITQIRTKRGTNEWEVSPGNLVPRFNLSRIRAFEPRLSVRGPIEKDRIFLAQDNQFRYVATPVKSLPDEPEIKLTSFDSFTRLDGVISARHTLGGGLIMFPRELRHVTMNTFRLIEATPDFNQSGWSAGGVDRFAIFPDLVLESLLSMRQFEIEVTADAETPGPMVYTPDFQTGAFFDDQERDVRSLQWVESLSLSRRLWLGEHVIKVGTDLQLSHYDGTSNSRPVEIRRLDGTLAELNEFGEPTAQSVEGVEFAMFAQDRWRLNSRLTFELGIRLDRDAVVERINYSPRAGAALSVLPEGRAILRGGYGKFVQRTPLNIGAFSSFAPRTVSRFSETGLQVGQPLTFVNRIDGELRSPEAEVGNVEWDQRFGRRFLLKVAGLVRSGAHEYILSPDAENGELRLSSTGTSRYRELETTVRYLGGGRRDLTVSYVLAKGTADLNNYDEYYGNLRNPILRANEYSLTPTDVRHRLLVRGTIGVGGQWDVAPVLELRSGFPWSAVNEYQDFVGPRNLAGRLPFVRTLDFSIARPWRFRNYRFRAGIKVYNIFGAAAERDIQNNVTSPFYGQAFNPVERSIGFVFGSAP